jgi:hypothetical protein
MPAWNLWSAMYCYSLVATIHGASQLLPNAC